MGELLIHCAEDTYSFCLMAQEYSWGLCLIKQHHSTLGRWFPTICIQGTPLLNLSFIVLCFIVSIQLPSRRQGEKAPDSRWFPPGTSAPVALPTLLSGTGTYFLAQCSSFLTAENSLLIILRPWALPSAPFNFLTLGNLIQIIFFFLIIHCQI